MLFGMTCDELGPASALLLAANPLAAIWPYLLLALGFSLVIFVHELGHFMAAKWAGVRVERFAIGFGKELIGFTRGETRYSFNILPLGGFVKMLGQEDFVVDKSGELKVKEDPRSFTSKPIGKRMIIVSAGVVMNLLFAAGALTIVAMVGQAVPPAAVGEVVPGSPADLAGLQTGDRILSVNGKTVDSFGSLKHKVVLSDPGDVLELEVERDGRLIKPNPKIIPAFKAEAKERQLGFSPGMNRRVWAASVINPDEAGPNGIRQKDELVRLAADDDDVARRSLGDFQRAAMANRGAPLDVLVRRPRDPDAISDEQLQQAGIEVESDLVPAQIQAIWFPLPYTPRDPTTQSLLGLVPRLTLSRVYTERSLGRAGVKPGDIVHKMGDEVAPTLKTFRELIEGNPDGSVPIEVCRVGADNDGLSGATVRVCVENREPLIAAAARGVAGALDLARQLASDAGLSTEETDTLIERLGKAEDAAAWRRWLERVDVHVLDPIKPKAPFALFSSPKPPIDGLVSAMDDTGLWVADVVEKLGNRESPAYAAGIPRDGAVILSAAGRPVRRWYELSEIFRTNAGRQIELTYRLGDEVKATTFSVPMCVSAGLNLPYGARIVKIDGKTSFSIKNDEGESRDLPLPNWRAIAGLLKASVGRSADVEFITAEGVAGTGRYAVTEDSVDPWQHRVRFAPTFMCYPLAERNPIRNPLKATVVGFQRAYEYTVVTIQTISHLVIKRNVSVEKVSGPVGIIAIGGRIAESGLTPLLWFLGVISANLAVINFLPMPIVDGGLFVFLLLEKIRGEPVSIKTQVATQLVGIALIATLFVLITYQDILKLFT